MCGSEALIFRREIEEGHVGPDNSTLRESAEQCVLDDAYVPDQWAYHS